MSRSENSGATSKGWSDGSMRVIHVHRAVSNRYVFAGVATVGIAMMIRWPQVSEPAVPSQRQKQEINLLKYPEHPMTTAMRAFQQSEERKLHELLLPSSQRPDSGRQHADRDPKQPTASRDPDRKHTAAAGDRSTASVSQRRQVQNDHNRLRW